MSFVNQYRSTTIYGELKVQKYNTGNINGLLDISGNTILRGDCTIDGNLSATDGTIDISGNLKVTGDISGNVTGMATNATNVTIASDSSNQSFFPTFVSASSGNLPLKTDGGLTYNPSTNILSCNVTGNVTGNLTGTASNATDATNVAIGTENTNTSFFPTFVSSTTGNLPLKTDGGLTYNPNSNILSCNVTGNLTGNVSGTATSVNVTDVSSNASFNVPFLSASTGSATISSDSAFQYNPSSNVLSVGSVSGSLSGTSTFAEQVIPSENADNVNQRVAFLSAATGSAYVRTDAGLVYNPLNNILTCGQFEGLATNATNVEVSPFSSNASFSIPYTSVASGITPLRTDPGLTYNPSSNLLSCDLDGTSLNATNVAIEEDDTDASFNVVFVSGTSGNNPLKVDSGLIYNPSTNILHTAVSKVDVGDGDELNDDFVIPFIEFDVGQTSFLSSNFIRYNPNTETLKVTQIETGTMNGFSTQVLAGYNTDNSNNPILFFKGTGFDTVNNVEATPHHAPGITYNPSTQTLNVTNINGTITNNASTCTILSDSSNQSFFPTFVSASSGNLPLKIDGGLRYNPSTNILSCDVSGNLTGTSSNVNITSSNAATAFRIPFASANTGSSTLLSDGDINFTPSSNSFSVSNITATNITATNITADSLSVGAGVWLIDGTNTGSVNAIVPLFTSQSDLGDINSQSTLDFDKQDNGEIAAGDYQEPFNNDNKIDTVIVFPKWGIVGFNGVDYDSTCNLNYKNNNAFPVFINPLDNVMSSCKIYYNNVLQ